MDADLDPPAEPPARRRDVLAAKVSRRLERLRTRGPVDFGLAVFERDQQAVGSVVGSAVAFRLFLFFVPLVLFVVGCAGFAADLIDDDDIEAVGIFGTLAGQIDGALTQSATTRWLAVGLGLFGMATAGRTLSRVMTQASCLAWQMPLRARASVRVIGTVVGLIAGIGAIAVVVNAVRTHVGVAVASVSFLGAAALYSLVWMVISARLPRPGSDPGVLLPGALVVGLTISGMQVVSQFYLPQRFSNASELYGALGVTIVVLSWFFLLGRVMVLSLTLDAVVFERYGSVSSWVFALPVLRRAARRWPWIRRTFQLDDEPTSGTEASVSSIRSSDGAGRRSPPRSGT